MDEEALHASIRKFLKTAGVGAQREIEQAVATALAAGTVADDGSLPATMTLRIPGLQLEAKFEGEIRLGGGEQR